VYDEVLTEAWQLYNRAVASGMGDQPNPSALADQAKALAVINQTNEKRHKLMTDLGLVKKAATEVKHTIEPSKFIAEWQDGTGKKNLGDSLVVGQLKQLAEPALEGELVDDEPEEEQDDPMDNHPSDLADPTPDDSEE
jgi:hypothetical protein